MQDAITKDLPSHGYEIRPIGALRNRQFGNNSRNRLAALAEFYSFPSVEPSYQLIGVPQSANVFTLGIPDCATMTPSASDA